MNTSEQYHGPVLEGLCAFVRENMTVKTASEKRSSPSSIRTSKAQSCTSSSWWRDQSIEVRDAINAEDDSFSIDPKEVRLILRAASTIGMALGKVVSLHVRSPTRIFSRRISKPEAVIPFMEPIRPGRDDGRSGWKAELKCTPR